MASSGEERTGRQPSPDAAVKGLADDELKSKLIRQHKVAEGHHYANCFVRPGRDQELDRINHDGPSQSDEEWDGDDTSPGSGPRGFSMPRERARRGRKSMAAPRATGAAEEEVYEPQEEEEEKKEEEESHRGRRERQGCCETGSAAADAAAGTASVVMSPSYPAGPSRVHGRPAASPHYDLGTPPASPPESRSPSPKPQREAGRRAQGGCVADRAARKEARHGPGKAHPSAVFLADKADRRRGAAAASSVLDDREKLEYEWQFEILNSLPRDRAIALVDYLRRSEQERREALSLASQLQRANSDLERRLLQSLGREDGGQSRRRLRPCHNDGGSQDCGRRLWRRCWCCCCPSGLCCCLGFLALPWLAFAWAALAAATGLSLLPPASLFLGEVRQFLGERWPELWPELFEGELGQRSLAVLRTHTGIDLGHLRDALCTQGGGGVRETTVREMTLRETTTRDYSREEFEQLQSEHAVMTKQFASLQNDIDDALHKGQDMVCWRV